MRILSAVNLPHLPADGLPVERTRFIDHRENRILLLDYRDLGASMDELGAEIERTRAFISTQPPASLLTLTDVRGSRITPGAVRAMQELVRHNAPFVKWSAVVVGFTGVYLTAFRAIQAVSRRRNLNAFNDIEQAKDWLVSRP
jgi:hypothetical protein